MISNTLLITGVNEGGILENSFVERIPIILNETEKMCRANDLDAKQTMHMRLLAEELICMLPELLNYGTGSFWIESEDKNYELHLKVEARDHFDVDIDKLLSVSKSGKNAAAKGIINKICIAVDYMLSDRAKLAEADPYSFYTMGMSDHSGTASWSLLDYRNNLQNSSASDSKEEDWDELEKSIIANLADDVIVGVIGRKINIVIKKAFN